MNSSGGNGGSAGADGVAGDGGHGGGGVGGSGGMGGRGAGGTGGSGGSGGADEVTCPGAVIGDPTSAPTIEITTARNTGDLRIEGVARNIDAREVHVLWAKTDKWYVQPVPPQKPVDPTIVDVCALGIKRPYPMRPLLRALPAMARAKRGTVDHRAMVPCRAHAPRDSRALR